MYEMPMYKAVYSIKKATLFFRADTLKEAVKKAKENADNFNKTLNATKRFMGVHRELLSLELYNEKPKVNLWQ